MDRRYKHLDSEEGGVILAEDRRGASLREIGILPGRSASAIGRELWRALPTLLRAVWRVGVSGAPPTPRAAPEPSSRRARTPGHGWKTHPALGAGTKLSAPTAASGGSVQGKGEPASG